jgi:hypothetical protein
MAMLMGMSVDIIFRFTLGLRIQSQTSPHELVDLPNASAK